jgi:hypothetical protein
MKLGIGNRLSTFSRQGKEGNEMELSRDRQQIVKNLKGFRPSRQRFELNVICVATTLLIRENMGGVHGYEYGTGAAELELPQGKAC